MTRAHKRRAGIIVVIALGVIVGARLLITRRPHALPLALRFERYGRVTTTDPATMDLFVQDVAFLWITNSSDQTYFMAQAGGTNTYLPDEPIGLKLSWSQVSYMPMCEFSDQPPAGSPRPLPPVTFGSLGQCVGVEPHSVLRLRVALPPEGQKRKIAVICTEPPLGVRPFWTSRVGGIAIRLLPRSVARKAMWREPAVVKVWCDRELSAGPEKPEMR